jgi:transcriptional regulator with XRE-family HTH domain
MLARVDPIKRRLIRKRHDLAVQLDEALARQPSPLTRRALAERAGLSETSLSRMLGVNGNPTLESIVRLEHALGEELLTAPTLLDAVVEANLDGPLRIHRLAPETRVRFDLTVRLNLHVVFWDAAGPAFSNPVLNRVRDDLEEAVEADRPLALPAERPLPITAALPQAAPVYA